MEIWEIVFLGVALSMDAFAVGLADGMTEPNMKQRKMLLVAGAFGLFQFLMPVLGYSLSSVFASLIEQIAPWLSFFILLFLGGKMILESLTEKETFGLGVGKKTGLFRLLSQAIATSIDALAVGVTMLAAETTSGLPFHMAVCSLIIGVITFGLSLVAVSVGKKAGSNFANRAEPLGGMILIAIGLKILLEALL